MVTKAVVNARAIQVEVFASPIVRARLLKRARIALPAAQREAIAAGAPGWGRKLRIEEGVRPGAKSPTKIKRPYARIIGPKAITEGDKPIDRQRILRRVVNQ
jgi:hypothetical protein